jgi:hypothetical protein
VLYPPSVKGWDGGQTWVNGQTLLFRQNLALTMTSTNPPYAKLNPAETAKHYQKTSDQQLVAFFLRLLLQDDAPAESKQRLLEYYKKAKSQTIPDYLPEDKGQPVRALCHLVMTLPEFQLD